MREGPLEAIWWQGGSPRTFAPERSLEIGYDRWAADTNETTFSDHVIKALNELVDRATEPGASKPRGVLTRHDLTPDH